MSEREAVAAMLCAAEHRPPIAVPFHSDPRCRIAACFLHQRAADAVLPLLAAAREEGRAEVRTEKSRVEELIEASSLGSAEAKAARESVPAEVGTAIALAARYLGQLNEARAAGRRVDALAAEWERIGGDNPGAIGLVRQVRAALAPDTEPTP